MRKILLWLLAGSLCGAAYAQEANEEQAEADAEVENENRPNMPGLFFSNEQRRILEVVRQEIISEESLDFDEFVPLVLTQQQEGVEQLETSAVAATRGHEVQLNAYVQNRSAGTGFVWINNVAYPLEDTEGFLERQDYLENLSFNEAGEMTGMDTANNSRFVLRVGQKLARNGDATETYPVIIVKKR